MRVEALLLVLTLGVGNCAGINRNVFSLFRITHSLVASASSPECKDGVCSLPPQNNTGKVRATVMSLSGGDDSSQDRTAFSGVKIVGDKGAATVETVNGEGYFNRNVQ